jgi:hypothetical protein
MWRVSTALVVSLVATGLALFALVSSRGALPAWRCFAGGQVLLVGRLGCNRLPDRRPRPEAVLTGRRVTKRHNR